MVDKDRKDEDDEPRGFASPACLMHEVDPAYMGLEPPAAEAPAASGGKRRAGVAPAVEAAEDSAGPAAATERG